MAKTLHRDWVFTSYSIPFVAAEEIKLDFVKFITWQIEECPETKRLHAQGYLELHEKALWSEVITYWKHPTHFDYRKGSQKQAIAYCSKEETRREGPFSVGEPHKQGVRSDLLEVQRLLDEKHEDTVMDQYFCTWIKYHKGFKEYLNNHTNKRDFKPHIFIYWGPPGTGKTRKVHEMHEDLYVKNTSKWWDGYRQNEAILLDDFDWSWDRAFMLQVLDRYPLTLEVKGGTTQMRSPFIYITMNSNPRDLPIWDDAFERRFEKIVEFKN